MKRYLLTCFAFAVATFATQAMSHFVINKDHYASVPHLRPEPIFALGISSMLIEAAILAHLYPRLAGSRRTLGTALAFSWLAGSFLVSYIALAEAAKYRVPAILPWIMVELGAGFVQFTLFGLLLAAIHREPAALKS